MEEQISSMRAATPWVPKKFITLQILLNLGPNKKTNDGHYFHEKELWAGTRRSRRMYATSKPKFNNLIFCISEYRKSKVPHGDTSCLQKAV